MWWKITKSRTERSVHGQTYSLNYPAGIYGRRAGILNSIAKRLAVRQSPRVWWLMISRFHLSRSYSNLSLGEYSNGRVLLHSKFICFFKKSSPYKDVCSNIFSFFWLCDFIGRHKTLNISRNSFFLNYVLAN